MLVCLHVRSQVRIQEKDKGKGGPEFVTSCAARRSTARRLLRRRRLSANLLRATAPCSALAPRQKGRRFHFSAFAQCWGAHAGRVLQTQGQGVNAGVISQKIARCGSLHDATAWWAVLLHRSWSHPSAEHSLLAGSAWTACGTTTGRGGVACMTTDPSKGIGGG